MDIRFGGAALLGILLAGLFLLFVISRRVPSIALFASSSAVAAAGFIGWLLLGAPSEAHPAAVVAALAALAGGIGGSMLTGLDCVREEAWRRVPAGPAVRPDDIVIRDLIRRIREGGGGAPLGECPHCGTRVCFREDLGCPACGKRLDQA
jgi:hypothetical protein